MKPYQVKLRIIGVLSLIVSMLVLWLPVPAKAVNGTAQTRWQEQFSPYVLQTVSAISADNRIDLGTYTGRENDLPGSTPEESALVATGMITVPDAAAVSPGGGGAPVLYYPRIGKENSAIFKDKSWLTRIDLRNVTIDRTATSLKELFSGCTSLREIIFPAGIDTTTVSDINSMFKGCSSLTELDLSSLDLSGFRPADKDKAEKYQEVFGGCNNLDVIKSPKNLDEAYKERIKLPDTFRYTYQLSGTDRYKTVDYLPTVSGDEGVTAGQSVMLYRTRDLKKLEIRRESDGSLVVENDGTKQGTPEKTIDEIEVGNDSETFQICLTPVTAEQLTITPRILSGTDCISIEPASLTVGTDGKATFRIKGKKVTTQPARIEFTASSTHMLHTESRPAILAVDVVEKKIGVQSLKIDDDFTHDVRNGDYPFKVTFTPAEPTNKNVSWKVDNESVATIDQNGVLKPLKPGTVVVTATSASNSAAEDTCTVTIISNYTLSPHDNRNDAINHIGFAGIPAVQYAPVKGNRTLQIDQTEEAAFGTMFSNREGNQKSFFTMKVMNGNTQVNTPTEENYGEVTVRMALPGKMWGKSGLYPEVYAAGSNTPVTTNRVTLGGYVEGVEFSVPVGQLAKAYALVLSDQRTALSMKVDDKRSNPGIASTVDKTDNTTLNQSVTLVIEEVTEQASTKAPKLYDYVTKHATYQHYTAKHYYLIYLMDAQGNEIDSFVELDVRLTLPSDVSVHSPDFVFLTQKENGEAAEVPTYTKETVGSAEALRYRPKHFSEAVVLDTADVSAYTIRTAHSGGAAGATTALSGDEVTAATATAGYDAQGTVPAGTTKAVTVTATPGDGYHVAYWLKDGATEQTGGDTFTFTPAGSAVVTAVLEQDDNNGTTPTPGPAPGPAPGPTYTVIIDPLPSAAGSAVSDKSSYSEGETATLTATANDDYTFLYWADAVTREPVSSSPTITMTMDGNKHLLAVFAQGEVAGADRPPVEATVNVSVPPIEVTTTPAEVTVNVPDINANVSVSVPDINVNVNYPGAVSYAGVSSSFIPVRIGNSIDMPRTGIGDIYRMIIAMLLVLSGAVEILLSIPAKKRVAARRGRM